MWLKANLLPRLLGVFAFLAALCAAVIASAEDWPRWRGPRGDGTWHAPPLPEVWPADGLKTVWRQPIGGGYAGVSVADGRVLIMDRQREPVEVERVLAFDAATGRQLWKHEYPVEYGKLDYGNGPRAAPTIHEGRVYTLGALGHVLCLDAATGKSLWSHDCVAEMQAKIPDWGLSASPVVWKNLVIVHVGVPGGSFVAFDRATGKEVWRASNDPAGYATPIIVNRSHGPQLVGWTPENVVGITLDSGHVDWQIPYKVTYGVSIATPIVRDDLVFVTGYWEGSKMVRLGQGPADAELAWEDTKQLRGLMSQPLERNGFVYSLDKQLGVTCFEMATGKKLWDDGNRLTPRGRNPQVTMVWLGDSDRTISLNAEGELVLARFTPQGYEEQSRTKIIGPTWAHPAYAGRHVFARDDAELVCVELIPTAH
ncbi:MAG TPA: PQQ-binding-like beta-propeller repeat protein [Pirellulales bacterium]|nr:PQQ-binding-like beta-propeller repeat protein [Pirellulales bacterium]